ncbi:MAG: hypothetical protein LBF15_06360 [Candidatus Peribacteria bacterium]|jgi:hypothetical protein|nr:hypothetical protein [Candidatus Peribacteria bacterium]
MFRVQSLLETEKMALSANANYLNSIKFPKRTLILDRGPFIKNPIEIKVW